jgi:hypothetical protein
MFSVMTEQLARERMRDRELEAQRARMLARLRATRRRQRRAAAAHRSWRAVLATR